MYINNAKHFDIAVPLGKLCLSENFTLQTKKRTKSIIVWAQKKCRLLLDITEHKRLFNNNYYYNYNYINLTKTKNLKFIYYYRYMIT